MKNRFDYPVRIIPIQISNSDQITFRKKVNEIPYLLYQVETLSDGTSIVINKPGGKRNFGRFSKNDIQVFIYNPETRNLWLISHSELEEDLTEKFRINEYETKRIIEGLYLVGCGEEPDKVISKMELTNPITEISVETIFKTYKWIWGQEDCNYPTGEGRWKSIKFLLKTFGVEPKTSELSENVKS